MEEQLISIKTAKLANEKGFDLQEPCTCGGYPDCICESVRESVKDHIYIPTQALLQKWLREKHDIHIYVCPTTFLSINLGAGTKTKEYGGGYVIKEQTHFLGRIDLKDTYEEALEACLKLSLNHL
jgi:hypothetical protein